ncbi:MAG: hypothetical protein F4213_09270 [Boseongicola sp. SB0677_bin_26]|nr:hypothetical protein [Boseongicola sp. SB0665_bin_10]MYG26201.1 hypothetical protein [Boseongicola sp. SB0677_bin_26]
MIGNATFATLLALAGPALAIPAFFQAEVPLWLAGLPLLGGIWAGTRLARAAAMFGWLAVPAAVSAIGLTGIGHAPELVWPGAAAVVVSIACVAACTGLLPATFLLALVPFFPASPLAALADVVPGTGIGGLCLVAAALAWVELLPSFRGRCLLAVLVALAAVNWTEFEGFRSPPSPWAELPEPPGLTERGRWIAIRDSLPEGSAAVLGEAVFHAGDASALDFWCRAAAAKDLTLFVGVTETSDGADRGAVWRLDRETCRVGSTPGVAARARLGIPGITGDWRPMPFVEPGAAGPHFLICLEGFLPWSWARLLASGAERDVVVLSNDGAFGALPVAVLRRKAAGALAALLKRGIAHAETGRTLLVRAEGAPE